MPQKSQPFWRDNQHHKSIGKLLVKALHTRFSLRHFLIFVTSCGVVLAAMRLGGVVAQAAILATCIFATAQLIVALVGSGARRAFAIGFLVPFCIYGGVHVAADKAPLDPYSSKAFPTTRGFKTIHQAMAQRSWIDHQTKKSVPKSDPRVVELESIGATALMTGAGMVTLQERPTRWMFALLVHAVTASMAGFLGAIYACRIHMSPKDG